MAEMNCELSQDAPTDQIRFLVRYCQASWRLTRWIPGMAPCSRAFLGYAAIAILLAGCGGSSGRGSGNPLGANLETLSRVEASRITIELSEDEIRSAALVSPYLQGAQPLDGRFYLVGIPIRPGLNRLELSADMQDGSTVRQELVLLNADLARPQLALRAEPGRCRPGDAVILSVHLAPGTDSPVEVLLDRDGDGQIEERRPFEDHIALEFEQEGVFTPSATLRLASGLMHTESLAITCVAGSGLEMAGQALSSINDIADIEEDPGNGRWLALRVDGRTLKGFGRDGADQGEHLIPAAIEPRGFTIAEDGDIFVVDPLIPGVIGLDAQDGYRLDPAFGTAGVAVGAGSALGEYDDPRDVVSFERNTGIGAETFLIVSDSGNARLQVLDAAGRSVREILGTEGGGPRFHRPGSLTRVGSFGFALADTGNELVRVFDCEGTERHRWSFDGLGNTFTLAWDGTAGELLVATEDFVRCSTPAGELCRILEFPTRPRALTSLSDSSGRRLAWVAESTLDGVQLEDLVEDPPGFSPHEIVDRVANAIASADLEPARLLLDEGLRLRLLELLGEGDSSRALIDGMTGLAPAIVAERVGPMAFLETAVETDPEQPPRLWTARRNASLGVWQVLDIQ